MSNYDSASGWAGISRLHKIIAAILALILLFGLFMGCRTAAVAPVAAVTTAATAVVPAAVQGLGWNWLDGKLTLTGAVKDEATKRAVVDGAVMRMGSAANVIDKLTVNSAAADLSFAGKLPDIAGWGVNGRGLTVAGSMVTLTGTVPIEGEKTQRGEAAALYFGSGYTIDNQIVVKAPAKAETVSLYFDTGKFNVQADAKTLLANIVAYGNASPNSKIQLSGFHDKRGDVAANKTLAKNRAVAVRDELKAAGLAEDRMVMVPPVELVGDADDKQARRVDVSIAQ